MSYDEYPELWEQATETAEECSECSVRDLEVPKGDSQKYQFCQKHHWEFYRDYMIRRKKGEKGKDDMTMEDIAEGLSEKWDKDVSTASTEYDAGEMEELVKELLDKMEEGSHSFLHSKTQIKHLNQIARYDTSLVKPVADELVRKVLLAERYPGYASPGANQLQEVLGLILADYPSFKDEIQKLIRSKKHDPLIWGLRALHTTAKLNPDVLFEEIEDKQLKSSIINFVTRSGSAKQIFSLVEEKLDYSSKDPRNKERQERNVKLEVINLMKYISLNYPEKILPHVDQIGEFEKEQKGHFDSVITLALIGREYPEKVERFRDQIQNRLGETSQSIDGEKHTLSGASALFFLTTGFDQDKFSEDQLNQEIRRLVDASKYETEKQIDAISSIGCIGDEEDIELIEFFKTEYSSREFKETVDQAVRKIKNRN